MSLSHEKDECSLPPKEILGDDDISKVYMLFHETNYGFIKINDEGYGVITNSRDDATLLKRRDRSDRSYFIVDSGKWRGYFLGIDVKNSSYLSAVRWPDARCLKVEEGGPDQDYYSILFNKKRCWLIRCENFDRDSYIRLGHRTGYEKQTFIKPYTPFPYKIDISDFWLFLRHIDEVVENQQSLLKSMVVQMKEELPFDLKYQMASEVGVNIKGIPVKHDQEHFFDFEHADENMREDLMRMNTVVIKKIHPGVSLWVKVRRFCCEEGGLIIDHYLDHAFVHRNASPGGGDDTLVSDNGKMIMSWRMYTTMHNLQQAVVQ